MVLKKKDFIEIEFTGKIKDGEIFDSNIQKDIDAMANNQNIQAKPFIYALGEDMFLKGVDDFLIGKELGEYKVELSSEKAFGKRDPKLIQMMPMKVFRQHQMNPVPGAMFNFDGRVAKILTVSGGRIMVDFNNPIAGRDVVYNLKVVRKLEDMNEKVKALIEFLFRKDFKFEIKEKKLIIHVEKQLAKFADMFKDKFKDILELELEVKEIEEKKQEVKK